MLLQFTVENFKSIKGQATLSMIANSGKEHGSSLIEFRNTKVLPSAAIYGANASGKSNLLNAMSVALILIRTSNQRQITERMNGIVPFKFDQKTISKPTVFDFVFVRNNKKYQYGFSADENKIYTEYLYEFKTSRRSMIFTRENTNEYVFPKIYEDEFNSYKLRNTENKLFLSTATEWNCEKTKDPFLWLANGIDTTDGSNIDALSGPSFSMIDTHKNDEQFISFMKNMLKEADINIASYDVKTGDMEKTNFPKFQLPPGLEITDEFFKNMKHIEITTHHNIIENNTTTDYQLSMNEESVGTRKYFLYAPFIISSLKSGKTLLVDEIDSSLHPLLVNYLVGLFNDSSVNINHAQLIFYYSRSKPVGS